MAPNRGINGVESQCESSAASKLEPWLSDADVTLYHGDVLSVLRELPAESVDCCVTSPPYWGLRDYGQEGQLGLEPTPEEYVARMVEVFREVRRVLAAHGTVWLNLGDSYAGSWGNQGRKAERGTQRPVNGPMLQRLHAPDCDMDEDCSCVYPDQGSHTGSWVNDHPTLKPKDLVGIPWRVAFALQADGWYLRSDIIWAKPNPMPESVTDRPTKAHEYLFLLSKQPRYFFDQEAAREKSLRAGDIPGGNNGRGVGEFGVAPHAPFNGPVPANRNIRSVWSIATQPYPEAHFATFPEELARRCIAAGTSERGKCPECGAPWVREVEVERLKPSLPSGNREVGKWNYPKEGVPHDASRRTHLGWLRSCEHDWQLAIAPCVVLDPFMGSGTVAHVARKLGRHAVGIDLNESYLELAARRLQQQSLFAEAASGL